MWAFAGLTNTQVMVSKYHQMGALFRSLRISLYVMNRLKVHFEYYTKLPASAATSHMRAALLQFCGTISIFLAEAILTCQKNIALFTIQVFWRDTTCLSFEEKCHRIAQRSETEAHNCDRQLSAQDR